jgi:hypothetical protein
VGQRCAHAGRRLFARHDRLAAFLLAQAGHRSDRLVGGSRSHRFGGLECGTLLMWGLGLLLACHVSGGEGVWFPYVLPGTGRLKGGEGKARNFI